MKEKNRSVNFSPINAVSYSSPKNIQQKQKKLHHDGKYNKNKNARFNPPFKDYSLSLMSFVTLPSRIDSKFPAST